jgi:FlaA1/EpsC-like NDP-sugar epimerase
MDQKRSSSRAIIVLADSIALALSVIGVFALRTSDFVRAFSISAGATFQSEAFTFYALTALILLPLFRLNGMYKYKVLINGLDQLVQIIKSFITIAILQILILFFWKDASFTESARGFIIGFGGFGILLVGLERYIVSRLIRAKVLLSSEVETKKALIIGAGRAGEKFALRILNDPELGVETAWFVDDDPQKVGTTLLGFPIYSGVDNITSHAIMTGADEIYIVINTIEHDRLMEIIEKCRRTGLPVKVLSRHFHIMYQNGRTVEGSLPAMLQLATPLYIRPGMIAKRGIDIIGGIVVALLISLPCAILALLIKLSSPGPVLYASERIGKGGKPCASTTVQSTCRRHRSV